MNSVTTRRWFLLLGLCFCLLLPAAAEKVSQDGSTDAKDAYSALEEVADFLELMDTEGSTVGLGGKSFLYWANNVRTLLKGGRFYIDTVDANAITSFGWNPDITVEKNFLLNNYRLVAKLPKGSELERRSRFAYLAETAATIYHEKIHVHQSGWLRCDAYEKPYETEAWQATIAAYSSWFDVYFNKYITLRESDPAGAKEALTQAFVLLDLWIYKLVDYQDKPFNYNKADYNKLLNTLKKQKAALEALQSGFRLRLEVAMSSFVGQIGEGGVGQADVMALQEEIRAIHSAIPRGQQLPTKEELSIELAGQGKAAGEIFLMTAENSGDRILEFSISPGMVLVPKDAAYQRMLLAEPVEFDIAPGETQEKIAVGYCLDPYLGPPPVGYTDYETACEHGSGEAGAKEAMEIVQAGNELAESGGYKNLFEPEKYKTTVIQRALWYEASKDREDAFDKEKLKEDLTEQLLEAGKNPQPEQIEQATDSLWEAVDLTLKKAGRPGSKS
jgi:hypothetical protein